MGVVFTIAFWPLVVPLVLLYVMAHPKYIPLFLWLCIVIPLAPLIIGSWTIAHNYPEIISQITELISNII